MTQKHVIKISVQLKVVRLLVRFPCKLTFQLKTDNSQVESRNSYQLKKGECLVSETLETEAEVNYDPINQQYEDRKVRLIIQMASTNGVIPAGSVSFNPCNKEYQEKVQYTLPLQKCPDRSAQITFFQSYQLLRKNTPQIVYQSQFQDRGSKISKLDLKYSTSNVLQSQAQRKSSRDISGNARGMRLTPSNNRDVSPRQRVKTTASNIQGYPSFKQSIHTENHQQQNYNELEGSQVVHQQPIAYGKYSSKYMQPNEKAQYIKEIAKLKGELKNLQSEDRWDQLIRIKEENQTLTTQLDKVRERLRTMERKERENNLLLKESREEADRNKSKYLQAESNKNESQVILADRERSNKELTNQLKKLQEKIQDLNIQLSNQQKRVEFKENSYQEQLRKINQKYTQSENERQKITFDYNTLLARLEEAEKKNQMNAKEKERTYTEEKNKLNKKIDQLNQALQKLKEEFSDKEGHFVELTNLHKTLTKKDGEREEKLTAVESELQLSKMMLKKEQDQHKLLDKEIQEYKIIEEERNILRKKNNQLNSQLNKLGDKSERLSSDLSTAENKVKDLQSSLSERTKEKDALNNKFNTLKKELDNIKKEEEKRIRESETLSVQNFNAGQKINDLKSKLQTEKRDTEELKAFYQEQLTYLAKGKEYCEHQIEELKWSLEKSQEQYQQVNSRLRTANQEILQLNQEILVSGERAKRSEEENKQLLNNLQGLRKEIVDWEQKERVLNQQVKTKGETVYDLQKKLQAGDSQSFILREKLKQIQAASEERRFSDQKNLKEREKALGQKGEETTQLQLQVMTLKEEVASLTQESAIKNNQIIYLKDSLQSAKQDVSNRDIKLQQCREELKVALVQIQNITKENQIKGKNIQEEKKGSLKMRKDWDDYRRDTTKALQQLIEQISKDEETGNFSKSSLLTFPDSTISAMQVQAIKKRNIILNKYQSKIAELTEEKAILEGQIKKSRKNATEKEEELQTIIKLEREKSKKEIFESEGHREELEKKIEALQEKKLQLTGQIQKAANQIKKREEYIEQLKDQIKIAAEENQLLRSQLKLAEEKILALKSNEIKWKANNDSKISEITGQNDSIMDRFKTSISELQKKVAIQEKNKKEKDQTIKKLQNKINELNYERERAEVRTLQVHQKWVLVGEEKTDLEKKIKTLEKDIKDTGIQLQNTKETLTNEKAKLQQVQLKLTETYAGFSEAQVQKQKLRGEVETCRQMIGELQESVKDKGDKLKVTGEKNSQQIKQLKEKIIGLNSTMELKDFQIGQQEAQINTLRENLNEAKEELSKKKADCIKMADKNQQYKNQELYNSQNIQILKSQKQFLEEENDRLKDRVNSLEEELSEAQLEIQTADMKQKEILKLREQIQSVKLQKDKMTSDMRNNQQTTRQSGMVASRMGGGDDKRRIRQLQQLLQTKHIDLSIERKKLLNQFERQKRLLATQNNDLKQEISNLQNQFDFQRSQLNKQIDSLNEECLRLTNEIAQRNDLLTAQQKLIQGVKNQDNAEQIQEYIGNIKSIFDRMQNSKHTEEGVGQHQQKLEEASQ